MTYHLLYESCPWHTRAALFDENGQLVSLRLDDQSRPYIEGAVVWGRVRVVEKSLGAAFVDIGDVLDGFLPLNTLPSGFGRLTEGRRLLVRITRGGFGEKGARLDARVALKEPSADTAAPLIMQRAPSALRRSLHDANAFPVTCWIPDARLRDDVRTTFAEKSIRQINDHTLLAKVAPADTHNSHNDWYDRLDAELDEMLKPQAKFMFNGGNLVVEMTSAVATIDVNAGPITKLARENAVLAVNLTAAEGVARLCRLLDLGGSVIIDFITPKNRAHRQLVSDHLSTTFHATDDRLVEIRPMSRFGLVELNRERSGPSIPLLLRLPSYIAGRILLELWRTPAGANPAIRQQIVRAHPDVIHHLKTRLTPEHALKHLGKPVMYQPDDLLDVTRYQIQS